MLFCGADDRRQRYQSRPLQKSTIERERLGPGNVDSAEHLRPPRDAAVTTRSGGDSHPFLAGSDGEKPAGPAWKGILSPGAILCQSVSSCRFDSDAAACRTPGNSETKLRTGPYRCEESPGERPKSGREPGAPDVILPCAASHIRAFTGRLVDRKFTRTLRRRASELS
jgi:hypothetical protein